MEPIEHERRDIPARSCVSLKSVGLDDGIEPAPKLLEVASGVT